MEVRQIEPIDRAELRATIQKWIDAHTDVDDTDGVGLLEDVLWEINAQPTLTPPNELLTLEQLREMDEPTPVWWKKAGFWCLCERGFIIAPNGNIYEFEETDGAFYRRPPEGEEDTK